MKTYALTTLGCKVNQYEGSELRGELSGYQAVEFGEPADIYIINSCGVTGEAEAKARQLVRRARRASPDALVVLTGCFDDARVSDFKELGVDLCVDNSGKAGLAGRINQIVGDNGAAKADQPPSQEPTPERARAFIKVQDGCDEHCSYCVVPHFRSNLVSKPAKEVVEEINGLVSAGKNEAVLTGIHLGKYGIDIDGKPLLAELIEQIMKRTKLARLRLSSMEPQEVSPELIEKVTGNPRIATHLHIPLQSGSDRILSLMNRQYNQEYFLKLVERLRAESPNIGLTTDIIVGFPDETDADFNETLEVMKAANFGRSHIFKFSRRRGAPAAVFSHQIEPELIKQRAITAKNLAFDLGSKFAQRFKGKDVSVLAEPAKNGNQAGLTGEYLRVQFDQAVNEAGRLMECRVLKTDGDRLMVRRNNG